MSAHSVLQTSGNVEWFTPAEIVDAARGLMGGIDLDPASCAEANLTVKAARFYSREDDGLSKPWLGRLWMNHPFGIAERACCPDVTGHGCTKKICAKRGWHQTADCAGNEGWIEKLVEAWERDEVTEAVCITFASMSEQWFRPLLQFPHCIPHGRTNYRAPGGGIAQGITKGSVITYLPSGPERIADFKRFFGKFGSIYQPV